MIVIQPRMTGGFWLVEPPRPEHIRLSFRLAKPDAMIWYCDARRLGKIHWFASPEAAGEAFARSHGPDALEIALDDLSARLRRTNRASSRRSWTRRSSPASATSTPTRSSSPPGSIPSERRRPLARALPAAPAITEVLHLAIAAEGSSFDAGYRTVLGLEGGFLAINAMYGRAGQPCRGCASPSRRPGSPA